MVLSRSWKPILNFFTLMNRVLVVCLNNDIYITSYFASVLHYKKRKINFKMINFTYRNSTYNGFSAAHVDIRNKSVLRAANKDRQRN